MDYLFIVAHETNLRKVNVRTRKHHIFRGLTEKVEPCKIKG